MNTVYQFFWLPNTRNILSVVSILNLSVKAAELLARKIWFKNPRQQGRWPCMLRFPLTWSTIYIVLAANFSNIILFNDRYPSSTRSLTMHLISLFLPLSLLSTAAAADYNASTPTSDALQLQEFECRCGAGSFLSMPHANITRRSESMQCHSYSKLPPSKPQRTCSYKKILLTFLSQKN